MTRPIKLSVDVMSGDKGPKPVIGGLFKAVKANPALTFVLHGNEKAIERQISKRSLIADRSEIRHAPDRVAMDAKPSQVVRRARDSSMWRAVKSVADGEADAVISCGNTGALMAMATLQLRRAPGIDRPAIAVLWPSRAAAGYNVVLDVGADVRADSRNLEQFAVMGAAYARLGLRQDKPRVGLLNVGTEETKGGAAIHDAHDLLAEESQDPNAGFEFVGFVEGDDISGDVVDVVVTDGFTGNIALKTAEGTAAFIRGHLGDAFKHSIWSRLGALFALTSLRRLQMRIDPRRVNGGVFLGLNGAVVKSHGDADATGVASAVALAARMAETAFVDRIAQRVALLSQGKHSEARAAGAAKA